jgi:hypothetical protein
LKNFSKIFYQFSLPRSDSRITAQSYLRLTPLDYDNIIPQRAQKVKRFWEISFRQVAQTFGEKMRGIMHFAQKRQGDGRRRADQKEKRWITPPLLFAT